MTAAAGAASDAVAKTAAPNGVIKGDGYALYNKSCLQMPELADNSIPLTVTSPPYWNAVDYDIPSKAGAAWHRERRYDSFDDAYHEFLQNIETAFKEVLSVTAEG